MISYFPSILILNSKPTFKNTHKRTVDRTPGEVLLQIPVEETITADQITASSTTIDVLSWTEEQRLALAVLLLKNKNHPYVSSVLPREHYSFWTMPSDLWTRLKLPRCYRESFQATRSAVLDFCTNLSLQEEEVSLQDKLWAFSMVRSRSIGVPELQQQVENGDTDQVPIALIPGLDLFNHAFDSGTLLQLEQEKDDGSKEINQEKESWTLTSSKSYKAGGKPLSTNFLLMSHIV